MRDIHNSLSPAILIAAAVLAADNTPVAVDVRGFDAMEVFLSIGAGGITFDATNRVDFILRHGDDTNIANHQPVAAGDLLLDGLAPASPVNGIVRSLTAAHAAGTVQKVGYIGGRRYLSLLADFSGTHGTGTAISAILARGFPNISPT